MCIVQLLAILIPCRGAPPRAVLSEVHPGEEDSVWSLSDSLVQKSLEILVAPSTG